MEHEPWADELLLWDGEPRRVNPPEPLARGTLDTELPSPLPFSKLGVADAGNDRPSESGTALGFFALVLTEGVAEFIDSAEPRLFCSNIGEGAYRKGLESVPILLPILGGWGKAAILIDRLTSLPGEPRPCSGLIDDDRRVGTTGVELVWKVSGERTGRTSLEGVRRASFEGVGDADVNRVVARPEGLMRVLEIGKVGRAEVGGGTEGSEILTAAMLKGCESGPKTVESRSGQIVCRFVLLSPNPSMVQDPTSIWPNVHNLQMHGTKDKG